MRKGVNKIHSLKILSLLPLLTIYIGYTDRKEKWDKNKTHL